MTAKFIRDVELSKLLGIPLPTIRADRSNERRLPFYKLGRSVLYDPDECIQAIKSISTFSAESKSGKHSNKNKLPSITKCGNEDDWDDANT